jgi:hypothetical protein
MNTRTVIASAVFAFAAAGTAFAQEATSDQWMHAAASKSRDQVQAELMQARADGSLKPLAAGYLPAVTVGRSRVDVVAETKAALRSGEIDRIGAETYAFEFQSRDAGTVKLARTGY